MLTKMWVKLLIKLKGHVDKKDIFSLHTQDVSFAIKLQMPFKKRALYQALSLIALSHLKD